MDTIEKVSLAIVEAKFDVLYATRASYSKMLFFFTKNLLPTNSKKTPQKS